MRGQDRGGMRVRGIQTCSVVKRRQEATYGACLHTFAVCLVWRPLHLQAEKSVGEEGETKFFYWVICYSPEARFLPQGGNRDAHAANSPKLI